MTAYNRVKVSPTVPLRVKTWRAPWLFAPLSKVGKSVRNPGLTRYITGNIIESSAITRWIAVATRVADASFAGMQDTGEGATTYKVYVNTPDLCNLTIYPKVDGNWRNSRPAFLNEYIVAANPDTTAFIFKVTTAGVFGTTEATWNTTPGATTTQGTAVLTCIAANVNPISLGVKRPS